ncbi:GNAT family N-acetyltransferase [Amycolatopsis acidiphila]|uniref:GNAT family N-acetyltransferase n=1 Tax=Amycolatopsis acidiphila TaxID=715473 RepID=A0A558AAR7_9PSEU|nr:GNAT family N-acetyltransferase [Amycolatopsis acidiphila]TVT21343.1 GNAT family N-acetyltransferase [Amycolatopsis acidiphila]UIJ63558.1 GNAT family N-acetyltransferase [Amycolatopsis acidiphila]
MAEAERALHRRAELAFAAARDAGLPGRFETWERVGVLAAVVSAPGLSFLSTLSGVTPQTVAAATDIVRASAWQGAAPTVLVSEELDETGERLSSAGFVRAADRMLAIRQLIGNPPPAGDPVAVTDDARFLDVLLAGYEVDGEVGAFIAAEHRHPDVRRFAVLHDAAPIAVAGMTKHGVVAVLGGAATLREHRGRGAQSVLLLHRLRLAAEDGCVLAVASARPGSVSATNLAKAGFELHRRAAWSMPPDPYLT